MTREASACNYSIYLTDEGRLFTMKTILAYEAGIRGLSMGQTFYDLVMSAIDIDSYPDEVREQLREIQERRSRRAAERSLRVAS